MRTGWLICGAAAIGAAWFAACSSDTSSALESTDGGSDALGDAPAGDAAGEGGPPAGRADVVILAMSDWRGQLEPVTELDDAGLPQTYGGLDALTTYFSAERAIAGDAGARTLFVTTGGAFGATPPLASASSDVPVVLGLN